MTDRLQEIKDRAAKATPGPWLRTDKPWLNPLVVFGPSQSWPTGWPENPDGHITQVCNTEYGDGDKMANADFIAHSRADVDYLIEFIEAFEAMAMAFGRGR